MRTFSILSKDLLQVLRDKKSLLFLIVMPVAFTVLMGFVLRGVYNPEQPSLRLGWLNQDPNGTISLALRSFLVEVEGLTLQDIPTEAEARQAVSEGELSAALLIPEGFSEQAMSGAPPQLVLLADTASEEGRLMQELMGPHVTRLLSAIEVARLHTQSLPEELRSKEKNEATARALELWQAAARRGPSVTHSEGREPNPYNHTSPGILLQFAIMGMSTSAALFVRERKDGTLARMLVTSLPRASIVAGHLLAMFSLVMMQLLLLLAFGQLVLGVEYLNQPLGTLLVSVSLAFWVSAMGLLIGVLSKSEEQVILYSLAASLLFAALGGAWFPLEGTDKLFSYVGSLTPGAWAMRGFQNLLLRGLDVSSVLLPSAILGLYGVTFLALALWRLPKGQVR